MVNRRSHMLTLTVCESEIIPWMIFLVLMFFTLILSFLPPAINAMPFMLIWKPLFFAMIVMLSPFLIRVGVDKILTLTRSPRRTRLFKT